MASSLPASYNFLDLCTTTGKLLLILPVSCSLVTFILTAKLSSFLLALSPAPSSPHPHVLRCSFQPTVTSLSAASLSRDLLLVTYWWLLPVGHPVAKDIFQSCSMSYWVVGKDTAETSWELRKTQPVSEWSTVRGDHTAYTHAWQIYGKCIGLATSH